MAMTVINLSGNDIQGLPVVNVKQEEETEKAEKTVFVKPHEDGFCFVSAYAKNGEIFIDYAEITVDSVEGADNVIDYCRKNGIKHIRYDFSVFIHEGKAIREALPDTDVYLYHPRQNLTERIIANLGFIKSKNFVFRKTAPKAYQEFIAIKQQFDSSVTSTYCNEAHLPKEAYNIAMDILSDVAGYYRRNAVQ
jgi:hypothetical protein